MTSSNLLNTNRTIKIENRNQFLKLSRNVVFFFLRLPGSAKITHRINHNMALLMVDQYLVQRMHVNITASMGGKWIIIESINI